MDQVLDEVEQDSSFCRESWHWITLSGGQCLVQPDFATALPAGAHERRIKTAENVPWMEQVMPHVDTVLDDHQVTDPELLKKWVGVDNRRALANFQQAYETFPKQTFIARTPFIPETNDDGEHIRAVLPFTRPCQNVVDHKLLPYCPFGEYEYGFPGRIYELENSQRPSAEIMHRPRAIIGEAFGRSHQPAPLANPSPVRDPCVVTSWTNPS